jgi:hypothetical protein
MLRPDEDWMPTLLIEGRDGRHVVGLGDLFSSEEAKQPSSCESRRRRGPRGFT